MSKLSYAGEEPEIYEVELFDRVDLRHEGCQFEGVVMVIHPRKREVTVSFLDDCAATRSGEPRKRRIRTSIVNVDLIARDG
jgi:hypothetical protein